MNGLEVDLLFQNYEEEFVTVSPCHQICHRICHQNDRNNLFRMSGHFRCGTDFPMYQSLNLFELSMYLFTRRPSAFIPEDECSDIESLKSSKLPISSMVVKQCFWEKKQRNENVIVTQSWRNESHGGNVFQPEPKVFVDNMEARDCKSSSVASPVFSSTPAKCNDSFTSCTLSRNSNEILTTFNFYFTFISSQFEVLNFFENFFIGILPNQICQIDFCLGKWLSLARFCNFF